MARRTVTLDDIERRHVSQHLKPYYTWIRHVVSLSTAALTLLVSLQNNYVPNEPRSVWLLAVCWGAFAMAVLSGICALHGEWQTPLDAAQALHRRRAVNGDMAVAAEVARNSGFVPRSIYRYARRLMICAFLVGVVSIAAFTIRNLTL